MREGHISESEFEHRRKSLASSLRRLWREGQRLADADAKADAGARGNPVSEALYLRDGLRLMEFIGPRAHSAAPTQAADFPPLDRPPE